MSDHHWSLGLHPFVCSYLQVKTSAIAATNIMTVVSQPITFVSGPFTSRPSTFLLLATNITTTRTGGARKPLMTAVQNKALIGLIPAKLISMPTNVETAIVP